MVRGVGVYGCVKVFMGEDRRNIHRREVKPP